MILKNTFIMQLPDENVTIAVKNNFCFLCLIEPLQSYWHNEHVQFLHHHHPVPINMAHSFVIINIDSKT